MRVYLDNCCFNRPFDDQSSFIIALETEAKLHVQDLIRNGSLELCWSFGCTFVKWLAKGTILSVVVPLL